jgi:hypothetical protein
MVLLHLKDHREEQKISKMREDRLLVSAWLNVDMDPIKELINHKAPFGQEFMIITMLTSHSS